MCKERYFVETQARRQHQVVTLTDDNNNDDKVHRNCTHKHAVLAEYAGNFSRCICSDSTGNLGVIKPYCI